MEMNEKRKQILYVITFIGIMFIFLGISYGIVRRFIGGNNNNTITMGTVTMNYTSESNGITLNNTMPMQDADGMLLTGENNVFTFNINITKNGSNGILYEVTAEDITTGEDKLGYNDVKLYLEKSVNAASYDTVALQPTRFTALQENDQFGAGVKEMVIDSGGVTSTTTIYYKLRMWVASDYLIQNKGTAKTFKVKVNAYGKDGVVQQSP